MCLVCLIWYFKDNFKMDIMQCRLLSLYFVCCCHPESEKLPKCGKVGISFERLPFSSQLRHHSPMLRSLSSSILADSVKQMGIPDRSKSFPYCQQKKWNFALNSTLVLEFVRAVIVVVVFNLLEDEFTLELILIPVLKPLTHV